MSGGRRHRWPPVVWLLAVSVASAACVPAAAAQDTAVQGRAAQGEAAGAVARPSPRAPLVDPDFGIGTREGFALRREVQMLQWVPGDAGGGDRLAWRDAAVEDTGLAPGHRNPGALPFAPMLWRTAARMPDGSELAPALLLEHGTWRLLPPDDDALPPNLAATFQHSGDVLTTAADPAHPQAGDLRLRWSALVLPPEAGFVRDGDGWRATLAAPVARPPVFGEPAADETGGGRWRFWLGAIVLLAIVAGIAARRRG